jgi:hypothetical protein
VNINKLAMNNDDFHEILRLADAGNSTYYFDIAARYEAGQTPVGKVLSRAFFWYKRAADEINDPDSSFAAGRFLLYGIGTKQDAACAVQYFERAFSSGMIEAGIVLSYCYMNAVGTHRNLVRARECAEKPHRHGYVLGTALLGKLERMHGHIAHGIWLHLQSVWRGGKIRHANPNDRRLFWLGDGGSGNGGPHLPN